MMVCNTIWNWTPALESSNYGGNWVLLHRTSRKKCFGCIKRYNRLQVGHLKAKKRARLKASSLFLHRHLPEHSVRNVLRRTLLRQTSFVIA